MDAGALSLVLTSCRRAWAVERADGPASRWPRLAPRPSIAQHCQDRQGLGVPEESLPMALACYSVCGWKLVETRGRIDLEAGCSEPVNGEGCRRHLAIQTRTVAEAFSAWTKLQAVLAEMEAYQPKLSPESPESLGDSAPETSSPLRESLESLESRESATELGQSQQRRPKWSPRIVKRPGSKPGR